MVAQTFQFCLKKRWYIYNYVVQRQMRKANVNVATKRTRSFCTLAFTHKFVDNQTAICFRQISTVQIVKIDKRQRTVAASLLTTFSFWLYNTKIYIL